LSLLPRFHLLFLWPVTKTLAEMAEGSTSCMCVVFHFIQKSDEDLIDTDICN